MKKSKTPKHFLNRPAYIGGAKAMREFITKNMKYPALALKHQIEGKVLVAYTVNHEGLVSNVKVKTKLGYGCDEEAVRLVQLLRFYVPKNRGVKVSFNKKITINFVLPKPRNIPTKVRYTYKTKASKEKTPQQVYKITYTIKTPEK